MIHLLYVGNFEHADGTMKLEKRESDGRPRPVVMRSVDMAVVRDLLRQKGVSENEIPEDWRLRIDDDGFVVCNRHTPNRDAIEFVRDLAKTTGCDIFYDGKFLVPPDELTFGWDKSEQKLAQ